MVKTSLRKTLRKKNGIRPIPDSPDLISDEILERVAELNEISEEEEEEREEEEEETEEDEQEREDLEHEELNEECMDNLLDKNVCIDWDDENEETITNKNNFQNKNMSSFHRMRDLINTVRDELTEAIGETMDSEKVKFSPLYKIKINIAAR